MLRLLGRRDYSSFELRARLVDRGHAADEVDTVIADLISSGIVDDRRVASAHVRMASQIKGRGRLRIQRELAARGIAADIASAALASLPEEDEEEALARVLSRRRLPARISMAERRRVFQQLLRRGFRADVIAKVLKLRENDTD